MSATNAIQGIQKSKSGCITCRVRKVKCDEQKPTCRRCQGSGRKCDGYQSNIRISQYASAAPSDSSASLDLALTYTSAPSHARLLDPGFASIMIMPPSIDEVRILAGAFTIKPPASMGVAYRTDISYEPEASATLHATYEPAIHHALVSVATLRNVFEQSSDLTTCCLQADSPQVSRGLFEYTHALGRLRARITSDGPAASKYSLLCCQMFITIELALDDFSAAVQHFTRGLRIMYEAGARPYWHSRDGKNLHVVPARANGLPMVDAFVSKLFLTPCPDGLTNSFLSTSDGHVFINEPAVETSAIRQANIRLAGLVRQTLRLVWDVCALASDISSATNLAAERISILNSLQQWRQGFSILTIGSPDHATARSQLGIAFSLFCCVSMQAIVTLVGQAPQHQLQTVKPIFDELLEMGNRLTKIKRQVQQFGRYATLSSVEPQSTLRI